MLGFGKVQKPMYETLCKLAQGFEEDDSGMLNWRGKALHSAFRRAKPLIKGGTVLGSIGNVKGKELGSSNPCSRITMSYCVIIPARRLEVSPEWYDKLAPALTKWIADFDWSMKNVPTASQAESWESVGQSKIMRRINGKLLMYRSMGRCEFRQARGESRLADGKTYSWEYGWIDQHNLIGW